MADDPADVALALGLLARRARAAIGAGLPVNPVRIVIFAKAPLPGLAKTRLLPALGAQGAAKLAQRMLVHTVAEAAAARIGTVEVCVTPSPMEPVWQSFALAGRVEWSDQGDGDLGARMARAAQRVTGSGESVLLVGSDCPALDAASLLRAAFLLQSVDATMVPTEDGGYVLLGLNRCHPSLFDNMQWSTAGVAAETRRRLAQLGWRSDEQPPLHDIDEPADLKWLPADWSDSTQLKPCRIAAASASGLGDHDNHEVQTRLSAGTTRKSG